MVYALSTICRCVPCVGLRKFTSPLHFNRLSVRPCLSPCRKHRSAPAKTNQPTVLILKLNKEAPLRKDVFRAPGHQGNMKKLIHFLQTGRLVNMDNFSVYTIASVLKKFLRKIPGGVFGREGEQQLFTVIQLDSMEQQRDQIYKLITSLPIYTQRLLVLLFGTFRVVAVNSDRARTGMSSEALGVSVAPSFFQSCVSDGKTAKMEDVLRFKVATRVMKFMIDNFGVSNLFGRENYEFYARITGRILKVEEDWIFSFRYPPDNLVSRQLSLEAEKTWLQYECERWGLKFNLESTGLSASAESVKRPSLRRTASREKSRLHRSSSRRHKENGTKNRGSIDPCKSRSMETMKMKRASQEPAEKIPKNKSDELLNDESPYSREFINDQTADISIGPQDCTEKDEHRFHVTLTYKPRI
ncbi:hypothetical protein G9C98_006895 [Cotesia typhae]|uniref:Rho-GAP domain-containing protein n=1 Tax=Cotesia typhae TaxID=2053667 RepID=A0A8J5V6C5_9HYME|nr:hypothetical protein G9C98_006895 [Cotesia typhae]